MLRASSSARSRSRARLLALALLASAGGAVPWGCGARTELPVPDLPSAGFCGKASYDSGFAGIGIYLLLDRSGSMANDGKWDSVTAAVASFVDDPLAAGIGMGMQYFPLSDECNDTAYATPATPFQILPTNAAAVKASLAAHSPDGNTPTVPALRGAIEFARAAMIADPSRKVLVVLATDGAPDDCQSDVAGTAAVAADGLGSKPQVITAVIGVAFAYSNALAAIAAAGGAGAPIPIGTGADAAQQFVDALRSIRDSAERCTYAVPPTPGATPQETDLRVIYQASPSAKGSALPLVAGPGACGAGSGFYVDDPSAPTTVTLCPGACQTAHGSSGSTVAVSAGCGAGSPPPGAPPEGDAGVCGGAVTFACVAQCGSTMTPVPPICVGGTWACGPGLVSTDLCTQCAPVPHGCCKSDGTLGEASCISGTWTCPPGAQRFGEGTCKPPSVCAATLPCSLSDYCQVPDGSCGTATLPGSCQPIPASCPSGGTPACGCDGQVYPSTCAASLAGVDVSAAGACPAPANTFSCGPLFCRVADQVCQRVDDFSKPLAPYSYACVPAPAGCTTGCGCNLCPPCPAGKKCGETCMSDPGGTAGRVLTCNEI